MASNCEDRVSPLLEDNISDLVNCNLNLKILKPLDEALRCRICYEYFNNCMITKCSHNYCSICIRKYMTYKSQCPTCFQDAAEPELRNNRLIDEILRLYKIVRESLQNPSPSQSIVKTEQAPVTESMAIKIKKEPSTSSQHEKAENLKDFPYVDFPEVSCPVCYKTVSGDRINIHLDKCLQVQEKESERKSLPKLVYHLLSDKEIRKKLKEHGLSTSGDKQTLIRRHKNFVTLFNANCDSLDPKSIEDLVLEIERQEIEERANSAPKQIQVNKKSDISHIEKEQQTYVKQHQSQFNSLINDIQQRNLGQKVVKQEVQEGCSEYCDSHLNKVIDDGANSTKLKHSSSDDSISSVLESCKTVKEGSSRKQKAKKGKEIHPVEDINPETLSSKIKELPFSKSLEKIQDTYTNDSQPLDDFDHGKMTKLSLLRKRKKGRISIGNPTSPKKK
ncbi:E3 ubiquitin-protein ligase RAD18 [Araneus ventricosus]|uniref:RING-type E3 ubiquitin transferase n=1 Tax=Araneus ventricosus TaxID=182803 RepID=A0A4Y2M7W6_ARAVE|nr:E3 ubiquitin-protein ligase RAD18 [Araneus ventricosus]